MKKIIALVLAAVMCLSLCACAKSQEAAECENLIRAIGTVSIDSKEAIEAAQRAYDSLNAEDKKAIAESAAVLHDAHSAYIFELSKVAYSNLVSAWHVADQFADDIYGIWHGCVWKKEEMSKNGIQFFVDNTSLDEEEIIEGLASRHYILLDFSRTGVNWNDLSDNDKQAYRNDIVKIFEKASRSGQVSAMDDSIYAIVNAYKLNGELYNAQKSLEAAKQAIKEISKEDSDYEYYPDLKGFYTTTSALIDFCTSPSGSFDQYKVSLNNYRKEAKEYMNALEFDFTD